MWIKIALTLVWDALKWAFSGWWQKHEQQEAINDAIKPYQKELAIKGKPAGTDDDIVNRL